MLQDSLFIKPKEAINILGVSYKTFNCWVRKGLIPAIKSPSGKQYLIQRKEINKYMELYHAPCITEFSWNE